MAPITASLLALLASTGVADETGKRRALMRSIGSVEEHVHVKAKADEEVGGHQDANGFAYQCRPPLNQNSGDAWVGTPLVSRFHQTLETFDPSIAALGDRLVKAADASEAAQPCGSFFNFGDYTWCNRAMPAESEYAKRNAYGGNFCNFTGSPASPALLDLGEVTKARAENNGQYVGLSYGIEETDPWSELMSNMFFVRTRLFDCYINSTVGPMFTDMHGTKERNAPCEGRHCYTVGYEANRVCLDRQAKESEGRKFEPLSASLSGRPPLSAFVKLDVEGSEWAVLEDLINSPEDIDRIRSLDMEVHLPYNTNNGISMERRVEIMEGLAKKFAVTGSQIEPLHQNINREYEKAKETNPDFKRKAYALYTSQGMPLELYTISFVNRRLLKGDDTSGREGAI